MCCAYAPAQTHPRIARRWPACSASGYTLSRASTVALMPPLSAASSTRLTSQRPMPSRPLRRWPRAGSPPRALASARARRAGPARAEERGSPHAQIGATAAAAVDAGAVGVAVRRAVGFVPHRSASARASRRPRTERLSALPHAPAAHPQHASRVRVCARAQWSARVRGDGIGVRARVGAGRTSSAVDRSDLIWVGRGEAADALSSSAHARSPACSPPSGEVGGAAPSWRCLA